MDGDNGWVEVRPAGSMGRGLFALKDIPRGTRIIAESPFLKISNCSENDLDTPAFCTAWRQLPKSDWDKFDRLSWNPTLVTRATRAKIREWYRGEDIVSPNGEALKGKKLQDVAKATTKRFAIFLTNRVEMGNRGAYGTGIFLLYSLINHSCVPNTHNAYNPILGRLTVHAIRDICANEQLTTSYITGACRTQSQRQMELKKWDFVCSCEACTEPSVDLLRSRMLDVDQGLAAFESPFAKMASRIPPAFAPMLSGRMPTSKKEALSYAEELVELLKQQGLEGMELCKTYRECSKFSFELGDELNALNYARHELALERCLIGLETAHLRDDMNGAEYWLAYLEQNYLSNGRKSS